jgi:hypothetical protein
MIRIGIVLGSVFRARYAKGAPLYWDMRVPEASRCS